MFLLTLLLLDCEFCTKVKIFAKTFSSETKTRVQVDFVLVQKYKPVFSWKYSGLVYEECQLNNVAYSFLSKSINITTSGWRNEEPTVSLF